MLQHDCKTCIPASYAGEISSIIQFFFLQKSRLGFAAKKIVRTDLTHIHTQTYNLLGGIVDRQNINIIYTYVHAYVNAETSRYLYTYTRAR